MPKNKEKLTEKFENIVGKMCSEFPIDKVDWNKRVAPYLREIKKLLNKAREAGREEVAEELKNWIHKKSLREQGSRVPELNEFLEYLIIKNDAQE